MSGSLHFVTGAVGVGSCGEKSCWTNTAWTRVSQLLSARLVCSVLLTAGSAASERQSEILEGARESSLSSNSPAGAKSALPGAKDA